MFAFGTNALVLALFFSALKFSDPSIGLFMTLTLLGDVHLSLLLTLVADKIGRRRILIGGSFLMVTAGVIFAVFENFWVLLIAAVVGVMSAAGGDFGPFRAIEESILSQLTTPNTRSDVLAWYVLISRLGSSIGAEATGRAVRYLETIDGWTTLKAYHTVFWVYSGMGFVNMALMALLSDRCEAVTKTESEEHEMLMANDDQSEDGVDNDQSPSENVSSSQQQAPSLKSEHGIFSKMTFISRGTRAVMYKLWFLLTMDAVTDGMVSYPLTSYYLDLKFHMSKSTLGDILSVSYFLACIGSLFAAPLAQFIGLVKTMVFTHLPSSAAVLLFPFPQNLPMTVALLLVRIGLNDMDQAPRTALIAAVVKPEERTAVMGITNMLRTLGSSIGPIFTGLLSGSDRFWVAFVVAGVLRIVYDLGLFAIFVNVNLYQHESQDHDSEATAVASSRSSDEEAAALHLKDEDKA